MCQMHLSVTFAHIAGGVYNLFELAYYRSVKASLMYVRRKQCTPVAGFLATIDGRRFMCYPVAFNSLAPLYTAL